MGRGAEAARRLAQSDFMLDIGRSSRCPHYTAAFEFTGKLLKVTLVVYEDQKLDGAGVGNPQMARQ
jgi:arylsulfatase